MVVQLSGRNSSPLSFQSRSSVTPTRKSRQRSNIEASLTGSTKKNKSQNHQQQLKPQLITTRPYTGDSRYIAEALCDAAESFITSYIEPRSILPANLDPKIQLAGNFAPVDTEVPPIQCPKVVGQIPECLRGGVYLRNGPNPLFEPVGGYHFFDGHGMLHGVKFNDEGTPFYCCRFTRTSRYEQEVAAGRCLFPNPLGNIHGVPGIARIGLFAMRVALGLVDRRNGIGTANAGLVYHDGKLLAMSEDDMPYAVRICEDGDFETLGRYGFSGEHRLEVPMTAHPKLDPETGELHSYSYTIFSRPFLKYFKVSGDGVKSPDVPIPLPEPVLLHDFVVTKNYTVFPENQMAFRLQNLFLKRKSALVCDEMKLPRFGVLPRGAQDSSEIRWFDVPGFTAFHFVNGWEEGEKIILLTSQLFPVSKTFDDPSAIRQVVNEVHLDLKTGLASQSRVSSAVLDIGQYNHRFTGKKMRYAYFSIYGPWPRFSGVAKVDLSVPRRWSSIAESSIAETSLDQDPAVVAWRKFGDTCYGSEPFFVPRTTAQGDEDDGFLLCYVHDESSGVSKLLVMDARSPKLETVAAIELPSRVPYGFHGLFVSKEDLAKQSTISPTS